MTDPVDTDALRNQQWQNVDELAEWATAAAAEVDRLRSRVVELEAMIVATSTDRRRLRAVIEKAPHADDCCYLEEDAVEPYGTRVSPHAHCTCWKADAL